MKIWNVTLVLVLLLATLALAACGGSEPAATPEEQAGAVVVDTGNSESAGGSPADRPDADALPANSRLSLGTMLLEDTEHAVTPEQAAALLPLWQALQSGSLQSEAEVNAVLKQIEAAMTSEQLAAIDALELTQESFREWAEKQGLPMGLAGGQGGQGGPADMSEEERANMRATRQAMGGGQGGFGDMSEEERANMRATMEAGGFAPGGEQGGAFPGGAPGARGGMGFFFAQPLIDLLSQRAAE